MKHRYQVQGMKCQRCVATIETALSKVAGVTSVNVALDSRTATIEMSSHITTDKLNSALQATEYRLTDEKTVIAPSFETPARTVKDFLPLIIIFSLIIFYTVFMLIRHGAWNTIYAICQFEGAFFLIFGVFKLLNWKGFVEAYSTYDIIAKRSQLYGYAYPLIEVGLGIAFLFSYQLLLISIISLVIVTLSTIGVAQALAKKQQILCACLGVVFKLPMTYITLLEDVLMGVMAIGMIVLLLAA